jgi:hypothetical protein
VFRGWLLCPLLSANVAPELLGLRALWLLIHLTLLILLVLGDVRLSGRLLIVLEFFAGSLDLL